jgi:hypothetical protein
LVRFLSLAMAYSPVTPLAVIAVVILLLTCSFHPETHFASAEVHHRHGAHAPYFHYHNRRNASLTGNMTLEAARQLLAQGQAAMVRANTLILENPRSNSYQVKNSTELEKTREPAPPLDYSNSTVPAFRRRQYNGNGTAYGGNSSSSTLSYTIPPELAEAARIVAEASHATPDRDSYASIVESLKSRFKPENNDTVAMPPLLKHPSGLLEVVKEPPSTFRYASNSSDEVEVHVSNKKRDANDWWMATIQQRGASPFAPAGYKVDSTSIRVTTAMY